jgi:hypothetical protein
MRLYFIKFLIYLILYYSGLLILFKFHQCLPAGRQGMSIIYSSPLVPMFRDGHFIRLYLHFINFINFMNFMNFMNFINFLLTLSRVNYSNRRFHRK